MHKIFISIFPSSVKSNLQNLIFVKGGERGPIFLKLKKALKQKGIEINTCDISTENPPNRYVYFDLPYFWNFWCLPVWKLIFLNRDKNILICNEPPFILPFNYMRVFHFFFRKVYVWNEKLINNGQAFSESKKYFKFKLPKTSVGIETRAKRFKEKKFLVLINANKLPFYPFKLLNHFGKELYSERIKAIEFFERNIPDRFFLYGRGWNKPKKYNLNEKWLGFKKYLTYKGEVVDKMKLLSTFKYCICFENLTGIDDYITEKIFECFKARCVPIYWGASNIEKYIPKGCFIDFRDFYDYEKLLKFLNSISENKYNRYIKNIEKLLADKKFNSLWLEDGHSKFFIEDVLEIKKTAKSKKIN